MEKVALGDYSNTIFTNPAVSKNAFHPKRGTTATLGDYRNHLVKQTKLPDPKVSSNASQELARFDRATKRDNRILRNVRYIAPRESAQGVFMVGKNAPLAIGGVGNVQRGVGLHEIGHLKDYAQRYPDRINLKEGTGKVGALGIDRNRRDRVRDLVERKHTKKGVEASRQRENKILTLARRKESRDKIVNEVQANRRAISSILGKRPLSQATAQEKQMIFELLLAQSSYYQTPASPGRSRLQRHFEHLSATGTKGNEKLQGKLRDYQYSRGMFSEPPIPRSVKQKTEEQLKRSADIVAKGGKPPQETRADIAWRDQLSKRKERLWERIAPTRKNPFSDAGTWRDMSKEQRIQYIDMAKRHKKRITSDFGQEFGKLYMKGTMKGLRRML